jgi:hypothetical protein
LNRVASAPLLGVVPLLAWLPPPLSCIPLLLLPLPASRVRPSKVCCPRSCTLKPGASLFFSPWCCALGPVLGGTRSPSRKIGSVVKRCRSSLVLPTIATWSMLCVSPVTASQSSWTVHSLPSPFSFSVPSFARLNPSATTLIFPGTCRTSTICWLRIPSLHLVCVAFSLSFIMTSRSAWQLVSISTGKPQIMSKNLSNANLSRNGLYFPSDRDVRFDANPSGCSFVTSHPFGSVVVNRWAKTAPNPSWQPSLVTMKCVPSHWGPLSTGSDVNIFFSPRNAWVWAGFQWSFSLWLSIVRL